MCVGGFVDSLARARGAEAVRFLGIDLPIDFDSS